LTIFGSVGTILESALTGNVTALERQARFVDADLNRHWVPARVNALRNGTPPADRSVEDEELLDLLEDIEETIDAARGDLVTMVRSTPLSPAGF